jgi:hypothetical protein
MALVIADRVKETTTTTGTGTINLAGAVAAFQTFVAGIGTGNTCYYAITSGNNWEIGLGTVTDASPDTLSRTTILASSNSDSAVTLSGTSTVFATYPAAKSVHLDASGNLSHTVDISSDTNLVGGTNITISGDTLNVDDAFLVNDASDTTTGTITAGGFTTTGTWTFDESTSGTIGITTIQDSGSSFSDNDTSLMTSAAIADKITASGGGGASDIDDLGDVSFGGTNLTKSLLINNAPGSAPTTGTLGSDCSYNLAIGDAALNSITDATQNVALGPSALTALTTGDNNIGVGYGALTAQTIGQTNIGIGYSAGGAGTAMNNCILIGRNSGLYLTGGDYNIAIGDTALGGYDGETDCSYNVAIGKSALEGHKTGNHNFAVGYEAGRNSTDGEHNIAFGYKAMYGNADNTAGNDYNVSIGYGSLQDITTGGYNIAIGHAAGANVTEGGHNILLGYQAGQTATTQSHILAIGVGAGSSATGSLGASIGPYAGENNTADYATFLGPYAGKSHTSGDYPVYVGHYAGYYSTDGDNNVGIGKYALMGSSGNTTGNDGNTAIGTSALAAIRTGDSNTAIGITAGHDTTTGSYNIYVGYRAGYANTTSSNLLFIGNTDEGSNGTLIKGDMANKFLAVGKADVTLATEDATLQVYPNGTDDSAYFAKMPGSHTGDLIRIENSSGTALFKVDKDGDITATSITASSATPYTTITGDTTVTTSNEVVFANATSGAIDVTLYLAASNGGKTLTIKKTDSSANAVSILRAGSETIDGATSSILYHQNEAVTLISDNSNWMII